VGIQSTLAFHPLKQSSGEDLPAPHAHIDISRVDLDTAADAAGHFGCD
jgi:hypothetical protein